MPNPPGSSIYLERLWPSPGIWAASLGFGAALGLIPAPVNAGVAVVVAVIGVLALGTFLVTSTPSVALTADSFTAGRAVVPLSMVASARTLDAEEMRQARGVRLDARAYLCLRGWLPAGVKIVLRDPEDPTPYWLVSSRRPDALVESLNALVR
jgi:Protein of unknown function (DUF3093)